MLRGGVHGDRISSLGSVSENVRSNSSGSGSGSCTSTITRKRVFDKVKSLAIDVVVLASIYASARVQVIF